MLELRKKLGLVDGAVGVGVNIMEKLKDKVRFLREIEISLIQTLGLVDSPLANYYCFCYICGVLCLWLTKYNNNHYYLY